MQVSGDLPFSIEIKFHRGAVGEAGALGGEFPAVFGEREAAFDAKFNATFPHLVVDNSQSLQQQYRVSKYALSI